MSFRIREATLADFPRIVEILNSQINEPTTLEEYHRQDESRPKDEPYYRAVAETEGGHVVAWGLTLHESFNRPGEWFIRVRVDGPYQRQGIGTSLHKHLEAFALEQGATRFESSVREQDTEAYTWAQGLGFATERHLCESILELAKWDPSPFADAVAEVKERGFRFQSLAELTQGWERETIFRRYYDFFIPMVMDIPGNDDRPEGSYEEWYDFVKTDPEWKMEHILIAVAPDGQWAAVSHIKQLASGALYNDFTGTARAFRGQGLTLPLKVEALNLASRLGKPYIRTNNLEANPRILAVNRRLGYEPSPGHYLLAKELEPKSAS